MLNFFSLNFRSIEIEGERVSSNQNKRTLWGPGEGGEEREGARKRTRAKRGEKGSKLGDLERTYFLNIP